MTAAVEDQMGGPENAAVPDVPHPGQWRLARIEVANWGTFSGYHSLPVSRKGLLITGESGSGKSSLLDAVTTVLTPPRSRHLNAAARSDGAKGEDRTVYSYIRGAWSSETGSSGEVASAYLRPRGAVWSGILLRYECGLDASREAVNLLALFHLKAGKIGREGASELYAVVRGDCGLPEFAPYASNGIDLARLHREKAGAKGYRDHSAFVSHFMRLLGVRGPKTLELLHRTQAAKNFGSLDDLFRRFMLDEPGTFEQAKAAVEQFSALDLAHDGVVDQRRQMEHLEPLVQLDEDNRTAQAAVDEAVRLGSEVTGFAEQVVVERLEAQLEARRREADRLAQALRAAEAESEAANQSLGQAQAALNDAGGFALDTAEKSCLEYERQLRTVRDNRAAIDEDLATVGLSTVPDTLEAWGELVRRVERDAQKEERAQREGKDAAYAQYGRVTTLHEEIDSRKKELAHLRSCPTNIPRNLDDVRRGVAEHIGVPPADLPFVGELISVNEEDAPWRGAIERVLGSQAKTLLVAREHARAVARYLDGRHLGLRFEFEDVPPAIEVPPISSAANSLVRKVSVKQHASYPEYSCWVNLLIRRKYDYACVDSPEELARHKRAVTIAGQVKRDTRYIKDDRHRVDDKTHWMLGDVNEEKVEELAEELRRLEARLVDEEAAAEAVTERMRHALSLARLAKRLHGAKWASYDLLGARQDLEAAQRHCEALKRSDGKMDAARKVRDEADARKRLADEALSDATLEERENSRAVAKLASELEKHRKRLAREGALSEEDRGKLAAVFAECGLERNQDPGSVYQVSVDAATVLNRRKDEAAEQRRKTQSAIERILSEYKRIWKAEAANLSEGFEERAAYLEIYRRIVASGLPSHEQEFLKVLNDFSQDQITVMATTIRDAIREVKDKIRQVNKSLELSEYSPGIHLQIEAKECRSAQVHDFLADLKAITEGSWNEADPASAEMRYLRTASVIGRLKSDASADQSWKRACLDTRQHVTFVAREVDAWGETQGVHASDVGLSGGQKQKLVIFCLAAALRYQLADEDEPVPSYGTVVLDEAFDKADHRFAATAMDIFETFGFHMVLATPMKLLQTVEEHIGAIAYVHCQDRKQSTMRLLDIERDEGPEAGEEAKE